MTCRRLVSNTNTQQTQTHNNNNDNKPTQGWAPGQGKPSQETKENTPGREMGQALMKRAIADIPLIHHMQKEAQGMYRLHNKNMCSEVQWKTFQGAEAMVSGEVEEVRREGREEEKDVRTPL